MIQILVVFLEVDLRYPNNIEEKKIFHYVPKNFISKDKYNDYMKKIEPKNYTKDKIIIFDWTDKKNIWFIIGCQKFMLDMVW